MPDTSSSPRRPSPIDRPPPGSTYDVPPEGSLALLALGARGIEAWRARRAESDAPAPSSFPSDRPHDDRTND